MARKPVAIRSDNGPEYISAVIQNWAKGMGIRLDYIQPGNPQQNAYVERFNRTVRYQLIEDLQEKAITVYQACRLLEVKHYLGRQCV